MATPEYEEAERRYPSAYHGHVGRIAFVDGAQWQADQDAAYKVFTDHMRVLADVYDNPDFITAGWVPTEVAFAIRNAARKAGVTL